MAKYDIEKPPPCPEAAKLGKGCLWRLHGFEIGWSLRGKGYMGTPGNSVVPFSRRKHSEPPSCREVKSRAEWGRAERAKRSEAD